MHDADRESVDLDVLLEEFLECSRRGETVSIEDYTTRYPHLAAEIRDVFSAASALEDLKVEADERLNPVPQQRPPPERVGDFRIVRELGRGGMGVVYEAEQVSLGRRVAVKVLLHQALRGSAEAQRFRREARVAARLHHTSIVTVYGAGEEDGLSYIVMELVDGAPLDRVIAKLAQTDTVPGLGEPAREEEPLDSVCRRVCGHGEGGLWRAAARIGVRLADALHHAHEHGVLHRDIKPGNVLVNEAGAVWLADFGLAKALRTGDATQTGSSAGTLRYMAPEQLRGETGTGSDLYSLGLVMYELLARKSAYEDTDRGRLIHRITHDRVPPLSASLSDVPRDLDTIVHKLTAPEPDHRYASAAALGADLTRFLDGRPINARPLAWPARLSRWARRNPAVAGLAAALVALGLATVGTTGVGLLQTRRALTRETQQRRRAEANAGLALEALDSMFARLAPVPFASRSDVIFGDQGDATVGLPNPPVLSAQAAALLHDLLPLYGRLASETGDESAVREKAAGANRRIGDVRLQLGQYGRAAESYLKASDMYRDLAREEESAQAVLERARIQNGLGQLSKMAGKAGEAEQAHRTALTLIAALPEAEHRRRDVRLEMARAHCFLGAGSELKAPPGRGEPRRDRTDANPHRRRERDEHLSEAVNLLTGLLKEFPDDAGCLCLLAVCYRQRPHANRGGGRATGPGSHEAAEEILEKLVRDHPDVPDLRYELAQCYAAVNLRRAHGGAPQERDTEERLRRGLELMEWLVRRHPYVSQYAAGRAQLCHKLSVVHRRAGRWAEAEKHCRRAVEELTILTEQNPDVATYTVWLGAYRNALADLLERRGRTAEARELLSRTLAALRAIGEEDGARSFAEELARQSERMMRKLRGP